jgi:hypothetical protein
MKDWEYLRDWQWDFTHVFMAFFLMATSMGGLVLFIYLVQGIVTDVLAHRRRKARCAAVYEQLAGEISARRAGAPESPPGPQ